MKENTTTSMGFMKKSHPHHSQFFRPSRFLWERFLGFLLPSLATTLLLCVFLDFFIESSRTNIYTTSTSLSRCFSFPTHLRIYTSIPNSGDQEFRTNSRVWINIGATAAGPSTHSFLQRQWCFSFSSHQKRGPGHGTWATQQNKRSQTGSVQG